MFRIGDLVEIPLPDGRSAIGWIIYISRHFKDCVGFMVLGIKGVQVETSQLGSTVTLKGFGPLYTNIRALAPAGWTTVASIPLEHRHRDLTRRNVAGEIYVGDENIGFSEDLDPLQRVPDMLVMGIEAVQKKILQVFPAI